MSNQAMEEKYLQAENFPPFIVVETTTRCNLKCTHCGHRVMTRQKGKMDMKLYRKITDEIAAVAPETHYWLTFYGEPLLLNYRLFNMIAYAKKAGLKNVVLNTNGTFLDEEMATGLIEAGLDRLIISIDATTKETYDKIRVNGDFERVKRNVEHLLERKRNGEFSVPEVTCQFSIMEENEHELDEYLDYWGSRGAILKPRPKLTWAGTVEADNLKDVERYPCFWMMGCICITWDGDITFCANDYDNRITQGNVNNQSIQSIWQTKIKAYRDAQLRSDYSSAPTFCQNCKDWNAEKNLDYYRYMSEKCKAEPIEVAPISSKP